ncbi:MAG: type II CAAX endopeptidase family protein [Litorilinea sp.]
MSTLASMLAMFLPLFTVMYIANMTEQRRRQEEPYQAGIIFTYLLLSLGFAGVLLIGLALQAIGYFIAPGLNTPGAGIPDMPTDLGFSLDSLPLLALGLWLPGLGGLLLLLRPIRLLLARAIPIDPDNPAHTVALTFVMLVLINLMITLGIGLGNLAALMEDGAAATSSESTALGLWGQQILMALLSFIGVGWLARRSWRESVARLSFTVPTLSQALIGVGLGVLMVPLMLGASYVASLLGVGVDPDVERLTEQMIGPLFESPLIGILTIGLSAALGEELLFRGALQPRFGLIFTSIIFALVHSNYGISVSTLIVFVLGLVLGWSRIRYNTSTAMIIHAVYNMTLGILTALSISFLDF